MTTPSIPPQTLLAGKIRLIQRIGRGGMGDVWVARNEATQAEVAVKTLPRNERTAVHDERFRREARLAATISHRNVVRIFDLLDEADGTLGLVMELLRGGTLETCIRERGLLSANQAIAVIAPILSALHHVHQKGIVHRDVKPANIFFAVEPDGHVIPKILDFGIAKLPAAGSALTMDGSVLGTPHYMSPEQIRGQEDIDGRSDMFSVGILLYEMLTGVRAFQRDSAAASLAAVLEHEVDPDPRIEPRVWLALSRALAKRPYERFGTCGELAEALRGAIDASEDDLQHSLQELRPRSDALPGTPPTTTDDGASPSASKELPVSGPNATRKKTSKASRTMLWTAVAAAAAALVAVTATLALTRAATPARAEEAPAASGGAGVVLAPPESSRPGQGGRGSPSPRDAVPPPEPAVDVPGPSAAPSGTGTGMGSSKPSAVAGPKPASAKPSAPSTTGTTAKPAGATSKPAGPGKPIATSPGF